MAKKNEVADLRDEVIEVINDGFNYNAAMSLDDPTDAYSYSRWVVPTGITLVDAGIGGGMMEGKVTRLYGPAGCGKTTFMYWSLAGAMAAGCTCVYFDPELTFDGTRARVLAASRGISWDDDRLTLLYPDTVEDLFAQIHQVMAQYNPVPKSYNKRPTLSTKLAIFIDTISNCPTQYEFDCTRKVKGEIKNVEGGGMSSRARLIRMEVRKLRKPLALHGGSIMITEQEIANLRQYGPSVTTSGGQGLPYMADHSLRVTASTAFQDDSTNREVGHVVKFKADKTRFGAPKFVAEVPLYYSNGFDDLESMFNFLVTGGLIKKSGNRLVLSDGSDEVKFFKKNWRETVADTKWVEFVEETVMANLDKLWIKRSNRR